MEGVYNEDCIKGMERIPDGSIDLCITDPPYEVNYGEKSKHLAKLGRGREWQIERDVCFDDKMPDYKIFADSLFRVMKDKSYTYIFATSSQLKKMIEVMEDAGFIMNQLLIWKKERCTFDLTTGGKFLENKEQILFFRKGWRKLNVNKNGDKRKFRSVLEFPSTKDTRYHSCSKPIPLISFLIRLSSDERDIMLDPFAGGGNHLISAYRENRRFIGFEKEETYYKLILERLGKEQRQMNISGWV